MKLNGLLKTLAPTIAKTIVSGNPVAGMAIKLLSDKLGIEEKNPAKIEKFLEKNPERAAEVKEYMVRMGVTENRVETAVVFDALKDIENPTTDQRVENRKVEVYHLAP